MKNNPVKSVGGLLFFLTGIVALVGCESKHRVELPSGYHDENAITKAEDLLDELETRPDPWNGNGHRTTNLPEEELKKVADALRKKYPIRSLRDRLHFQATHPKPVVRIAEGSGRRYHDGFFSQRARALAELHSDEVHHFINRNGQGITRMPLPQPADLRIWNNRTEKLQSIKVDSMILEESLVELPKSFAKDEANSWGINRYAFSASGIPSRDLAFRFHHSTSTGFTSKETFGHVKSIDEVAGFEAHKIRFGKNQRLTLRPQDNEELRKHDPTLSRLDVSWKLNRLELVSLLMHREPQVYETEYLPDMEELSDADVKTRPLSEFESQGLEQLQKGEELFTVATHNRIVMLGAVRANKSCMECHWSREGELLGAFSYEFLRDPREPEPPPGQKSF